MQTYRRSRRVFLKAVGLVVVAGGGQVPAGQGQGRRPNILLAIADDQSWPHAGAYGDRMVQTAAFDRVAREGVLFTRAYCPAPQCSPSRAALLTGRNIWQLEEAGTHGSLFPAKFKVYPELLAAAGYHVGYTGKPWAPGNWKAGGRSQNPAGPGYNRRTLTPPTKGISRNDYAGNFADFLAARPAGAPFCFWYGGHEPHRAYEAGSGVAAGKSPDQARVPGFLPDHDVVRGDLLDYAQEIDWFDRHLGRMIGHLEAMGELEDTLIVVTADNGMPFPHAKANLYEHGTHVPLAMRWPMVIKAGRRVDDFVSFIDLAPTFLEAAGVAVPQEMTGRSLMGILRSDGSGRVEPGRDFVLTGRERHTHARPDNLGYPSRAIRTDRWLYIFNCKPERWPAGDPPRYYDIDGSPTKDWLLEHADEPTIKPYADAAVSRRPKEELYDVHVDPACMTNLAGRAEYEAIRRRLHDRLERLLIEQGDPRVFGAGDVFESYPRFMSMRGREFSGFSERGQYNPAYRPEPGAGPSREPVGLR